MKLTRDTSPRDLWADFDHKQPLFFYVEKKGVTSTHFKVINYWITWTRAFFPLSHTVSYGPIVPIFCKGLHLKPFYGREGEKRRRKSGKKWAFAHKMSPVLANFGEISLRGQERNLGTLYLASWSRSFFKARLICIFSQWVKILKII